MYTQTCEKCGCQFGAKYRCAKYCKPCRKVRNAEYNAEYYPKWYARQKAKRKAERVDQTMEPDWEHAELWFDERLAGVSGRARRYAISHGFDPEKLEELVSRCVARLWYACVNRACTGKHISLAWTCPEYRHIEMMTSELTNYNVDENCWPTQEEID